jgi:hypothetical protein
MLSERFEGVSIIDSADANAFDRTFELITHDEMASCAGAGILSTAYKTSKRLAGVVQRMLPRSGESAQTRIAVQFCSDMRPVTAL